jgi:hypothetical protein
MAAAAPMVSATMVTMAIPIRIMPPVIAAVASVIAAVVPVMAAVVTVRVAAT